MHSKIRSFVEGVSSIDDVACVMLYGSVSANVSDSLSDYDVLVVLDSDNFVTPRPAYEQIARCVSPGVKPTIKSISEFTPGNHVTLTRRFLLHLRNVGRVLYEVDGLGFKKRVEELYPVYTPHYPYALGASLIIRHRFFELCRGVADKALNDSKTSFDRPSKWFWHAAVDALEMDLSPE